MKPLILELPGNEAFAASFRTAVDGERLHCEFRNFPDGETYLRIDGDCDGRDVVVVSTLHEPDPKFLPLYFAATTARDLGARRVIAVAPYLAYMRQDKAFRDGEAVTAHQFPRLLSSCIDGLVTVDPHLHRIHDLGEVYSVPTVNVHAAPAIADWVRDRVRDPVFIGPDVESRQWVADVATRIGAPYVALQKIRRGDRKVSVSAPELGGHDGRTQVIVDDIVSTARTMIETVHNLRQLGTPDPVCIGVHAIFAGDAHAALRDAGAAMIATVNTIGHPTNAIDVAPLVADGYRTLEG
jgi:ribose-phosphate pyrophosphokinase